MPHRLVAAAVFLFALALYAVTVSPTAALWDVGEFIASAYGLQVMHPPGAPAYMLLGRLFSMLVPAEHVAVAVNLVSGVASAGAVGLTYLIIVRLVGGMQARRGRGSALEAVVAGVVGALTLAASSSFWFSAVEAEVYGLAIGLVALVVWLSLRWAAEVEASGLQGFAGLTGRGARWLVLIAFVLGLSTGVHLMVLLSVVFLFGLAYAQLFHRAGPLRQHAVRVVLFGIGAALVFAAIYPGVVLQVPMLMGATGSPLAVIGAMAVLLVGGLLIAHRKRWALVQLGLLCLGAVLVGYSSYTLIPIRSAADPLIDLNDPETAEALVPYLRRDQYGQRSLLRGPTYSDTLGRLDPDADILFPRRASFEPSHQALYARYGSDADYFWRYQLGHMYARYLLWNFAGRASDEQNAPWTAGLVDAHEEAYVYGTPSERAARNAYYGLPLLLGLLGMAWQLRRDPGRASAVGLLFLATGLGLVVYLNEIPSTPRERDYIFVVSFFAFALWVGLGAAAVLSGLGRASKWIGHRLGRRALLGAAAAVLVLAVPGRMLVENVDDHDRSGNVLARDWAYNLLNSLEEDAIVFTGGDNDTYPLWYAQAVEGVRPDVRVVCLPLLGTSWYALQLKHQAALDAAPVPMALSDAQIEAVAARGYAGWEPQELALPVEPERLTQQTELRISVEDTSGFERPMRWRLDGRDLGVGVPLLSPADQYILDILAANARSGWLRPIYFSAASSPADRLDLDPYLQREGLALRVVPIRHEQPGGRVVPELMLDRLARFRFTNLADPSVYYAADARTLAGVHYRNAFAAAARSLADAERPDTAEAVLDRLMDEVPPDTIPLLPYSALQVADAYGRAGAIEKRAAVVRVAEPRLVHDLARADTIAALRQAAEAVQYAQLVYMDAGDYDGAAGLSAHLAAAVGDPGLRATPDELRRLYEQAL